MLGGVLQPLVADQVDAEDVRRGLGAGGEVLRDVVDEERRRRGASGQRLHRRALRAAVGDEGDVETERGEVADTRHRLIRGDVGQDHDGRPRRQGRQYLLRRLDGLQSIQIGADFVE